MSEPCDHILPRWDVGIGWIKRDDLPTCILPHRHDGPHAFINDFGERVRWQTDYCDDCDTPDDYCGCYTHWVDQAKQ